MRAAHDRSTDQLVRTQQHRLRNCDSKGLGGLEVNDQLKLRCLLNGQIAWLGTIQDFVRESGSLTIDLSRDLRRSKCEGE
jgi:hypothetical protein